MAATTVGDLIKRQAQLDPSRIALKEPVHATNPSERLWRYADLITESEGSARALAALFSPGERIAVWAPAKPEWTFLQLGAALAGLTLVTLNPANRRKETADLMSRSKVAGIFLDRSFRGFGMQETIEELQPKLPLLRVIQYFDMWSEFVRAGDSGMMLPVVAPDAPSLIVFTSGTTGAPKGVVLTHAGIVSNAQRVTSRYRLPEGSIWLNTLPLFHVGGSVNMTLGCMCNVGTHVMFPEFNAERTLRSIAEDRASMTMAVPTMIMALAERPELARTDLSSLKVLVTGGTTVPPEIVRLVQEKFRVNLHVVFGQTEAGGVMTQTFPGDTQHHICSTVGQALPQCEMKVINTDTASIQPLGEVGEICTRSPSVMKEYFEDPKATRSTLDAEGWVHTGDLGVMESDGYIRIVGRLKDMIIRGGENIFPREVEDALVDHPDILEAAVFGIADDRWGEQVVAAVRLAPGATFDEDLAKEFLLERIGRHKIPKLWMVVDTLPYVGLGKVQKFLLRERFLASQDPSNPTGD